MSTQKDRHFEELIPWFVTNKLYGDDLRDVNKYLADSKHCAPLVEDEHKLSAAINDICTAAAINMPPSKWQDFQKTLATQNIEQSNSISQTPSNITQFPFINRAKQRLNQPKTLRMIAMAQAAALIAIVTIPNINNGLDYNKTGNDELNSQDIKTYNTLSNDEISTSQNTNLIMQFKPDMTVDTLNQFLVSHNAQLISGPTQTNAYLVKIPTSDKSFNIERLRANKNVILAEPIGSE